MRQGVRADSAWPGSRHRIWSAWRPGSSPSAISRFFQRLIQSAKRPAFSGGLLDVDVGDLFRGLEPQFSALIDALYQGKRLVSRTVDLNKALGHVYAALELEPTIEFQVKY